MFFLNIVNVNFVRFGYDFLVHALLGRGTFSWSWSGGEDLTLTLHQYVMVSLLALNLNTWDLDYLLISDDT